MFLTSSFLHAFKALFCSFFFSLFFSILSFLFLSFVFCYSRVTVVFGWTFCNIWVMEIFHATVPALPVAQVTILRLDYASV